MAHLVYGSIVAAIKSGALQEPFSIQDFRSAVPGLGSSTYGTFPAKHAVGNPSGVSELFEREASGKYSVLRPFRYGL